MKSLTTALFVGLLTIPCAQSQTPVSNNVARDAGVPPPAANATVTGALAAANSSRAIPDTPSGVLPLTSYTLALKWNDLRQDVTLNYQNTLKQVVTVYGVQAAGNLFVVDYPHTIPPLGTASISLAFIAQSDTQSDSDTVRLLTSDGIKLLRVVHARDPAVALSAQQLSWQVGEVATPKSVKITLGYGIKLTGAKAMLGQTATIQNLSDGVYQIDVTPKSTAKPISFPVILTFDQAIPGAAPLITCVVSAN